MRMHVILADQKKNLKRGSEYAEAERQEKAYDVHKISRTPAGTSE